jgi:hypothetical protein
VILHVRYTPRHGKADSAADSAFSAAPVPRASKSYPDSAGGIMAIVTSSCNLSVP